MVKIPGSVINLAVKSLYVSLGTDIIVKIARMVEPGFDIYKSSGFRESLPVASQDAAATVVRTMVQSDQFLPLVEAMIIVDEQGLMGRKYPIANLRELIKALGQSGFIYDRVNNLFLEDSRQRRTLGWGRLAEGQECNLAFLRLDIVHNSKIVRSHGQDELEQVFGELRDLVAHKVEKRLGRIWTWEGDGGLAAFFYGHRQSLATLAAMDILHGLELLNRLRNPLSVPILLRLAIHTGQAKFSQDPANWKKNDVIRQVIELESKHTAPGSLTISRQTEVALDRNFSSFFKPVKTPDGNTVFNYSLSWEGL